MALSHAGERKKEQTAIFALCFLLEKRAIALFFREKMTDGRSQADYRACGEKDGVSVAGIFLGGFFPLSRRSRADRVIWGAL